MSSYTFLLVALLLGTAHAGSSRWEPVRQALDAFWPIKDMAFTAGDVTGRKFTYEKGATNMTSPLFMASASKFPAAIAIVGVVADGHVSFDTRVYEVFPWWTSDPHDKRSRVTLRHLLSFTSGFYSPDAGGELPCLRVGSTNYTWEDCAKEIFHDAPFEFEPGSTWCYNSFHLQVAGAMAAKAANISLQQLLQVYLIDKLRLTATSWIGGENPLLAASMSTTGEDYDRILRAYVSYEVVPKQLANEMERDYLEGSVQIANSSGFLTRLLGHYSMCNYFECFFPKLQDFTPRCKKANVHMDAGLFGYYPLVDRASGTYMQIVRMKIVKSLNDFQPTISALTLRLLIKHKVDQALAPQGDATKSAINAAAASEKDHIWDAAREVLSRAGMGDLYNSPADLWPDDTDESSVVI